MNRHRPTFILAALGSALLLTVPVVPAHVGDDGSTSLIHACAHIRTGRVRIVGPSGECKRKEEAVHWSTGEGAVAAGQSCPANQFVTGFDAEGGLICSLPLFVASSTMAFESEGFDLETGAILAAELPFPAAVDFHFVFNSVTPNHVRLFQNNGDKIAFLDATPFGSVAPAAAASATFTASDVDSPFDADDTILVKTPSGSVYKVGNPVNNADLSVTFNYAQLN